MAPSSKRNVYLIAITAVGVVAAHFAARSDKFMLFLIIIVIALGIFAAGRALYRAFKVPHI